MTIGLVSVRSAGAGPPSLAHGDTRSGSHRVAYGSRSGCRGDPSCARPSVPVSHRVRSERQGPLSIRARTSRCTGAPCRPHAHTMRWAPSNASASAAWLPGPTSRGATYGSRAGSVQRHAKRLTMSRAPNPQRFANPTHLRIVGSSLVSSAVDDWPLGSIAPGSRRPHPPGQGRALRPRASCSPRLT
jgi:hypothetical protein